MEVCMDLKWRKFKNQFIFLLTLDFIFALFLSLLGYKFVVLTDCKIADEPVEEKLCKDTFPDGFDGKYCYYIFNQEHIARIFDTQTALLQNDEDNFHSNASEDFITFLNDSGYYEYDELRQYNKGDVGLNVYCHNNNTLR